MVPEVRFYLVGSCLTGVYRRDNSEPHDIDVVAVLPQHDFEVTFGFTHQQLMDAYKEKPYGARLEAYLNANRLSGWVLSSMLGKHVDFKWILPSMLYKPHGEVTLKLLMEVPL